MLLYVSNPVTEQVKSPSLLNFIRAVLGLPQTETHTKKFNTDDNHTVTVSIKRQGYPEDFHADDLAYFLCDASDLAALIGLKYANERELRRFIDGHSRARAILAERLESQVAYLGQKTKLRTPKDLRNDIKVRLNEGPINGLDEIKELWGPRANTAIRILNDLVNGGEIDSAKVRDKTSKNGTKTLYFTTYVLKTV